MKSTLSELTPDPNVILTEMEDGTGVLLNVTTKFYYTLSETAVVVWRKLQEGSAVDGAIAALVADFEVERAEAEKDVEALLEELLSDGLVTPR